MKLCLSLMSRAIICFHVYIILDFPITYRNASVLCQSECACLHKTVNIVVFFVKSNENTYPKGRALMQMYRVVPIMKNGLSSPTSKHFFVNYREFSFIVMRPYKQLTCDFCFQDEFVSSFNSLICKGQSKLRRFCLLLGI